METQTTAKHTLEATVYPPCRCGRPWPEHQGERPACAAYAPVRPVEYHGVIFQQE